MPSEADDGGHDMTDRVDSLRARWAEYDKEYRDGGASRETVIAAYDDWASAVDSERAEIFDAREGGKLLREIGVKTSSL